MDIHPLIFDTRDVAAMMTCLAVVVEQYRDSDDPDIIDLVDRSNGLIKRFEELFND